MRVKVKRDELIAQLESKRDEIRRDHQKKVDAHPDAVARYRVNLEAALTRALDDVQHGKPLPPAESSYNGSRRVDGVLVAVKGAYPIEPGKPNTQRIESRLKALRMSNEASISIDPDEWKELL